MSEKTSFSSGGGGCLSVILFIFLITALIWGLPTGWGTLIIDIFPPYIGIK